MDSIENGKAYLDNSLYKWIEVSGHFKRQENKKGHIKKYQISTITFLTFYYFVAWEVPF